MAAYQPNLLSKGVVLSWRHDSANWEHTQTINKAEEMSSYFLPLLYSLFTPIEIVKIANDIQRVVTHHYPEHFI